MKYNDAYLEWYETAAEGYLNDINEKMSKVISVFTPNDMKILEGILDSGSGAELQQARQILTNTQKLTPDGGYVYPVKFNPTNWFELLSTSFTPVDLLENPSVLALKLQSLSTRRIELNSQLVDLSSLIKDKSKKVEDLYNSISTIKSEFETAENGLIEGYGAGAKAVVDAVLDIAPLFQEAAIPEDIIKKLATDGGVENIDSFVDNLTKSLADVSKAQKKYVSAAQDLADATKELAADRTIAQLNNLLSPLRTQLEEIDLEIKNLQSKIQIASTVDTSTSAATPPKVPKGFTQVYIGAETTSLDKATTSKSSSDVASSGASFWFCGYKSEKISSSSSFRDISKTEGLNIEIGMNVAKVGIEREWFNPGVFVLTKDMFNVTTSKIAPAPDTPYMEMSEDRILDMATNNYIFPCYPTAMVIARDISIKLSSQNFINKEFSSLVEEHASTGGGFLFFSGASSSSSEDSSSGVHARSYDKTITLRFDTPQIIGYYMEATPADKSSFIDDTSEDNKAGYVTIEQFVKDYEKMLAEMKKQKEQKKE